MKKLKLDDKKAIIGIVILILSLIFLTLVTVNFIKTLKAKKTNKAIQVSKDITNNIEKIEEKANEEVVEEEENVVENNKKTTNKDSNSTTSSSTSYYIKINYGANVITIYTQDENGDYTVPIKAIVCSTGRATPRSGVYKTQGKWHWGALFGGLYGQYCTHITGNILCHSVPYLRKGDNNSLEYWEYDKLGTAASAGCIRMTVADAMWIYYNIPIGTPVEFYSDSNPGPLRKTASKKNIWR